MDTVGPAPTIQATNTIHPLARRTEGALKDARIDHRGFLFPQDPRVTAHLRVTSAGLPRAISVLSALLRALEDHGHAVSWLKEPRAKLTALVHGEKIALRIAESVRTSMLTVYLQNVEFYYVSRNRSDEKHRRIEDRLEEIILEFTRMADVIKEARQNLERFRRELEVQLLWEEEVRKQKELYLRKSEVVKRAARSLETAQSIRQLVVCLGSAAKIDELNGDLCARFKGMLEWCTEYANSLDPTNRLPGLVEEFSNPPVVWRGHMDRE